MQNIVLNVKFKKGTREIKTVVADELEAILEECRWIMKTAIGVELISFVAFGSNYIIVKF